MNIRFVSNMDTGWMKSDKTLYIDVHHKLLPFSQVLDLFRRIDAEFDVLKYCNGFNAGGRFIFQILSQEFIEELAGIINNSIEDSRGKGPILEIMGGDGKLSEFLRPRVHGELIATDSKRDAHDIAYPKWVIKEDAMDAVRRFTPAIALMSWEPLLSSVGYDIVEMGLPLIWIGDPEYCAAESGLLRMHHERTRSRYALGRRDDFSSDEFRTDIYLFNWFSHDR